jgi:hypothetical protein
MQYVCDAPNGCTWFRMESDNEAALESEVMRHAVEKHFRRAQDAARVTFKPASQNFIERDIGLDAHVLRSMPMFLTLRDANGAALVTAMLPPGGKMPEESEAGPFRMIVVGQANADPYPQHGEAIAALGRHFGLDLPREQCFPYHQG